MIDKANDLAFNRMVSAEPQVESVSKAEDVIPFLADKFSLLHSGPPSTWQNLPGPTKAALMGAVVYEGWARTYEKACSMLENGEVQLGSCHDHNAVGPMAGVISSSMPVYVVTDQRFGMTAFVTINEGLGKVLRYGGLGDEVLTRLKWIEKILGPALNLILEKGGPIILKPIIATALHRGDECHNRNHSATTFLFKILAPMLLNTSLKRSTIHQVLKFIGANDHFFLNLSMGAAKVMASSAHGVKYSSLVTAMASNGVEFGIQVSGTGRNWYTAPAPRVNARYLAGFSDADASPVLGDSPIIETVGYGAFALAAAPAILSYIGGTMNIAVEIMDRMQKICTGTNPNFQIPFLDYRGTPTGIDIFKVLETGIVPLMDVGVAHREAGRGQVGAGLVPAALECFEKAGQDLSRQ